MAMFECNLNSNLGIENLLGYLGMSLALEKQTGNNGANNNSTVTQDNNGIHLSGSGQNSNNTSGLLKLTGVSFKGYKKLEITVSSYYQSGDNNLYDENIGFGETLSSQKGWITTGWIKNQKISSAGTYTFDISGCDDSKKYQIGYGYVLNDSGVRRVTISKIRLT